MPGRFADRREAGRALVARLGRYAGRDDVIVLALPRGGVPVAWEVARVLGEPAPADVRLAQPFPLDHRPHRPVEDEDPLTQSDAKLGDAIGHREVPSPSTRPRSRQADSGVRRFSDLFNVAAIAANHHGCDCRPRGARV